ncbi:hypothetical protein ACFQH3_10705 [Haladaptatus sp. GCM10025707]
MTFIAEELREIMADLGFRTVEEMVGRVEALEQRTDVSQEKAKKVDLSAVLAPLAGEARTKTEEQNHDLDSQLDHALIEQAMPALQRREPVAIESGITNVDRAVGAMLSNRISTKFGGDGLADDTIAIDFEGTAGQSFGAFLASGVTMHLTGIANDYVGKGLSGGKIAVQTPPTASYAADENVLIGNVAFYGATEGEAYINGIAGERFCVRNSGVKAVVEGVGDHGCEYMTGGVAVVLGETGKNFAAGMSGGVAYVFDENDTLAGKANTGMVSLERDLAERDRRMLKRLVENHAAYTGSERAKRLLENWDAALTSFVKVMPDAYAEVIGERDTEDVRTELPQSATEFTEAPAGNGFALSDD